MDNPYQMSQPPLSPSGPARVLALGGQARSGSTLIDRALGQAHGFVSAGEIRYLWDRGLEADERCGCGEPLRSSCPFWLEVGQVAFGGWDRLDLVEVLSLRTEVDRLSRLPLLWTPGLAPSFERKVRRYAAYLGRIYPAVRDVAGARVVIDSTMSPLHVLLLRQVIGLDLRVAHLVRDGRGVAFSSTKRVARPEITDRTVYMPTYTPPDTALRWETTNAVFEALARSVPTVRIRYEDFARDPRATLERLAEHAGVPLGPADDGLVRDDRLTLGVDHTVAGNPMRFTTGEITIRADEAWREDMPGRDRRIVTSLAWPLLRRYGYR
jgi:Sulfotransferase family